MEILKHPMGVFGAIVFVVLLVMIQGNTGIPGSSFFSEKRETQADGYSWTPYCEELSRQHFDYDHNGRVKPIARYGKILPRYREGFDAMVDAHCDPRKTSVGKFPGIRRVR
ncbi:MAG: hypothetical protein WBA51_03430 [Erythrobacter sp.]